MGKMSERWGWKRRADGGWDMPEDKAAFLQWLITPPEEREPRTQQDWAEQHGYHPSTVRNWKRDPNFREEWDKALQAMNISPDRVQSVVDALYNKAVNERDTKAAELYLRMVEKISPPKIIIEDKGVEEMSDDELAQALAERQKHLKAV